jgi:signal transduction histidine kinase
MAGSGWSRLARHGGLPVLVAVLGIALSIGAWGYLVKERRFRIAAIASDVAAQSRRTVETNLRNRIYALRNLAGFWAAVGRRPVEEWRADADLLIETYPSIAYIAWIYPDGHLHRVAPGRYESPEEIEIEPGESRRQGREARIVGPERDDGGAIGLRVFVPVRRGDNDLGVLEARIQLEPLLTTALQESAPGYAIRVTWNGEELYRRGEPSGDPWQTWWREEGAVRLPMGVEWKMEHEPTADLASAWLTPVPHYLLGAGIVLAIVVGLLVHYLRLASLHARFLAAGNEALEANAGELRRLNETLEARVAERTRELEHFNHSISHDLKSPLGAILNFAAILEADYHDRLDDEGRDMLMRIRRSALRGTDLLEGLLRLSRAGQSALESTSIALARECFEQARIADLVAAPDSEVEFAASPLPRARGDRTLVSEILVNLFDNALKYTRGKEKRRIEVRGSIENGECLYEISDNGEGFDMRFSDKLFGLFERLHSSPAIAGTGIGLALVERIVRRHGGRVWAEGVTGEGACFRFTLPAAESIP